MLKRDKIRLLKIGLSCLRRKEDKRPIFSPTSPTKKEIENIKNSLEKGNVEEDLLKKFFPMAYDGVNKYGFFKYFFYVHNKLIRSLERYQNKLYEWCTAYPAVIVSKINSKYVVETIDKKRLVTDSKVYPGIIAEKNLKIGDFVVLHRNKIHMKLNEKEFKIAIKFYNKFKEECNK